jgi:hypothetical protein
MQTIIFIDDKGYQYSQSVTSNSDLKENIDRIAGNSQYILAIYDHEKNVYLNENNAHSEHYHFMAK